MRAEGAEGFLACFAKFLCGLCEGLFSRRVRSENARRGRRGFLGVLCEVPLRSLRGIVFAQSSQRVSLRSLRVPLRSLRERRFSRRVRREMHAEFAEVFFTFFAKFLCGLCKGLFSRRVRRGMHAEAAGGFLACFAKNRHKKTPTVVAGVFAPPLGLEPRTP